MLDIFSHCHVEFPFPIVIVNHFPKGDFTKSFCRELVNKTKTPVREAEDGEILVKGMVYLCPGGMHLTLKTVPRGTKILLDNDPAIDGCKPSIDKFFSSASRLSLRKIVSFVLTGMGHDGTIGARDLRSKHHHVFTQDKESCTIYGMPYEVDKAGLSEKSLSIVEIAQKLCASPRAKKKSESTLESVGDLSQSTQVTSMITRASSPRSTSLAISTPLDNPSVDVPLKPVPTAIPRGEFKVSANEMVLLKKVISEKTSNHTYLEGKDHVLLEKITPIAHAHDCNTFHSFYEKLKSQQQLVDELIAVTTVHESYFFRDHYPYRYLKDELFPQWESSSGLKSMWSSACSNGQELYSMIFTLREFLETHSSKLTSSQVKIYASDISRPNVDFAKAALYSKSMVRRGLRSEQLEKYFVEDQGQLRVKREYQWPVQFRQLNLLDSLHSLPLMDCIFCRYTLIYLSEVDQQKAIVALTQKLKPNGVLILDPAMSLRINTEKLESFNYERFKLFRKKP